MWSPTDMDVYFLYAPKWVKPVFVWIKGCIFFLYSGLTYFKDSILFTGLTTFFGAILWSTLVAQLSKLALYQQTRIESWATGVYRFFCIRNSRRSPTF